MARTHFCKHQRSARILIALAVSAAWWTVGFAHGSRLHHDQVTISGSPPSYVTVGQGYSFMPSATDSQGRTLAFAITNRPSWATFSTSSGQLSGTPSAASAGTYPNIVITASDGRTSAALPAFTVQVLTSTASRVSTPPPTISGVPPTTDVAGSPYSFKPSASGASGATLAFSVQNKPAWASFNIASGLLSGTPSGTQTAVYPNIILSVSDGTNSSSLPAFSITVSSAGGSSSSGTTQTTILFEQPQESGIAGHFAVPLATHKGPPTGAFALVLWQPNRYESDGLLVPTGWDAGADTGFTPSVAMTGQLGFQNKPGTSTAQMEADAVGAYINSQDLPQSSADQKMMITPEFTFPVGAQPMPFASPGSSLNGSLDLQIPTAVGSDVYVVEDLLFEGPNGVRISFGIAIFHNGGVPSVAGSGYDSPSNTYMLNSPLGIDQRFVTRAADSDGATGTPWSGWRHFEWSISEDQFVSGLQYLNGAFPANVTSTDPVNYVLAKVHLNAEFHTKGHPAQLGWSMRGLTLWTAP